MRKLFLSLFVFLVLATSMVSASCSSCWEDCNCYYCYPDCDCDCYDYCDYDCCEITNVDVTTPTLHPDNVDECDDRSIKATKEKYFLLLYAIRSNTNVEKMVRESNK